MFLQSLYEFAVSRKLLADEAFQEKAIRWVIPIDDDGNLIGNGPIETQGEKNKGKAFLAPRTSRPKNAGGVAEFLADALTSVFGLDPEPEKATGKKREDRDENNKRKRENFWRQVDEAVEATNHPDLIALKRFGERFADGVPFLRYGKQTPEKSSEKAIWWLKTSTGDEVKLGPDQFTFQVGGRLLIENEDVIKPYWREAFAREKQETDSASAPGICLVSGQINVPIALTHLPKIQGVPNTQAFGAAVVSFDKPAFTSFGLDQSRNAPVSTVAAAGYCNALRYLLSRDDHSIKIGDSVVCFWAKAEEAVTGFIARILSKPDPVSVREFLKSPWAGVDRDLAKRDRFYSVTLSGNAGRIVVRHWLQTTVECACENLRNWFSDLDIVTIAEAGGDREKSRRKTAEKTDKDKMPPLALFRLACATVRDAKEMKVDVPAQLYRAALEGTAPSLTLLKPVLSRLEADLIKFGPKTLLNSSRFSLIRLLLNRNRKEGEPMIERKVFETDDPAYNCGRLLAVFDDLQMAAHDWKLEGAGVVERYYGTASSAPNSAFGILWRLHQHHLKKISRNGKQAAAEAIKRQIADIVCRIQPRGPNQAPSFPRVFNMQEQGRFALGFYQQKAEMDAQRREARARKTGEKDTAAGTGDETN